MLLKKEVLEIPPQINNVITNFFEDSQEAIYFYDYDISQVTASSQVIGSHPASIENSQVSTYGGFYFNFLSNLRNSTSIACFLSYTRLILISTSTDLFSIDTLKYLLVPVSLYEDFSVQNLNEYWTLFKIKNYPVGACYKQVNSETSLKKYLLILPKDTINSFHVLPISQNTFYDTFIQEVSQNFLSRTEELLLANNMEVTYDSGI